MNLKFYPFLNLRYNHDLFLFTKAKPLSSFCLFCGQQGMEVLQDCSPTRAVFANGTLGLTDRFSKLFFWLLSINPSTTKCLVIFATKKLYFYFDLLVLYGYFW